MLSSRQCDQNLSFRFQLLTMMREGMKGTEGEVRARTDGRVIPCRLGRGRRRCRSSRYLGDTSHV